MLYRDYKALRAGQYYHVFNRGVNKQLIFFDEEDYLQFLKRLKVILGLKSPSLFKTHIKALPRDAFSILAYCLMPNHFHMFIRQNSDIGIDKLILKLCTSYSIYVNKKYARVGALFQDRFKAKPVEDDQYGLYLSAYIHNNPESPGTYPYSSLTEILECLNDSICDRSLLLSWFKNSTEAYIQFISNFEKLNREFKQQFSFEA